MFPRALRREIVVILAVKAAVLTILYLLFFSPAHRVEPSHMQLRLFQSPIS